MPCLLDIDLIGVEHFGFMQGRFASLQPLNVLNDLTKAWESNTEEDVIYQE